MIVLCNVLSFYKQAISISEDESKGHGGANRKCAYYKRGNEFSG